MYNIVFLISRNYMKLKVIIITLIFISSINSIYGKEIKIEGKIGNLKNTSVYLKIRGQNSVEIIDSFLVDNENFHFKFINKELSIYYISIPSYKITITLIPERNIQIIGNTNLPESFQIKGSLETTIFNKWNQKTKELGFEWITMNAEKQKYLDQNDTLAANKLTQQLNSLKNQYDKNDLSMIEDYPNTFMALFILSKVYLNLSFVQFKKYIRLIKPASKNHTLYKTLKSKYNILEKTKIGIIAPNFSIENLNSKEIIDLTNINSRYILLDFWGSWCGPCIKSIPDIKRIYLNNKLDFLQIISIAVDDISSKEKLNNLIAKNKMDWAHGFIDIKDKENSVIVGYSVISFPTYILIGPDRKIIFRDNGTANFDILSKILQDKN